MARVLVATPEPVADRVAGPAIRAAHIARVLGAEHEVTLVSLAGPSSSPIDGAEVHGPDAIDPENFDAAVVQGSILVAHPDLAESSVPIVCDWFDPFHLEALHRGGSDNILRQDLIEGARTALWQQAERGDFFVCSNEAQRGHWLGWLAAAGRVNHRSHDHDPTLRALIALAPFGLDRQVSPPRESPVRSAFDQIGPDDPVLVWAGGLHDWLDPISVISAMPTVLDENPDSRLVFLAGPHPNTSIETMGVRGDAIAAARDARLFGKHVLFVNQWIPYAERLDWIASADIGVVAHHDHLETEFSHRTRLLDHLAAGIPSVSTAGDPASDLLRGAGAASVVPPGDPQAFGEAAAALIRDAETRDQMSRSARDLAATLKWESTLAPLVAWMRDPRPARDRVGGSTRSVGQAVQQPRTVDVVKKRVRMHWEDGGLKQVVGRGIAAARRRLSA